MPFILIHLGCLAAFYTGVSATALWVAVGLYAFRVFSLTAFYHRYFLIALLRQIGFGSLFLLLLV